MKKTYAKPEIMFEDFSLSNAITAGCEKIAQATENACAYIVSTNYGDFNVFTPELIGVCDTTRADGDYNGICYHVPTAANNVFTS